MTYIRSVADSMGISADYFQKHDIHVHVPAGAIPKDGPSAGVAMTTALASMVTGRPVDADVAMTGEVTLTGQVLPVGGIKEKVLAARRAGIQKIFLPDRNEADVAEIKDDLIADVEFVYADHVQQVLAHALEEPGDTATRRRQEEGRPPDPPSKSKAAASKPKARVQNQAGAARPRPAKDKAAASAAERRRRHAHGGRAVRRVTGGAAVAAGAAADERRRP